MRYLKWTVALLLVCAAVMLALAAWSEPPVVTEIGRDAYSRFYRIEDRDNRIVCYAVANSGSSYGGQAIACLETRR